MTMSDNFNSNPEPQLGKVRQPGRKSGGVKLADADKDKIILDFILSCEEFEAEALFPIIKTAPSKEGKVELVDDTFKAINRYLNYGLPTTDASQDVIVKHRVAKAEKLSGLVARFIDKRQSVDVCVQLMKLAYNPGRAGKKKTVECAIGQQNYFPPVNEGVAGSAENNLFSGDAVGE